MGYVTGIFSGVKYKAYYFGDSTPTTELNNMVSQGQQNNVVAVFQMPESFVPIGMLDHQTAVPELYPVSQDYTVYRPSTLDGYTPINRKLFTMPYCYLAVDCGNDAKNYRYEFFDTPAAVHFKAYMPVTPNPELLLAPINYNGSPTDDQNPAATVPTTYGNFTETLTMTGFPQCAYVIDSYRAWLAQKASGEFLGAIGSLGATAAGMITGNAPLIGTGISSAIGLAQTINQAHIEATQNTKVRGNVGSDTATAIYRKKIYFKRMSISAEYARNIDGFFDKYGYAQNTFAIPDRGVRPHWTFVKTANCNANSTSTGGVPADTLKRIKDIYNKGITFWRNLSEVGDYTLDNRPVTAGGNNG